MWEEKTFSDLCMAHWIGWDSDFQDEQIDSLA